jgi:hypothetical protein
MRLGFGGPQPTIVFNRTDEPKAGKLRLHIDVNATDREDHGLPNHWASTPLCGRP